MLGVTLLIFLAILSIIEGVAVYNLLRKVEKYEDYIQKQEKAKEEFVESLAKDLVESKMYLKSLDEKGIFESDDEIGYYFRQLQKVQDTLDRYIISK